MLSEFECEDNASGSQFVKHLCNAWDLTKSCRATICNLLIPPCEGTGLERYRKPCKAFEQAIKHGCGLDINLGDLSFAEPPDCYELPIRKGEAEYADAEAIGSDSVDSGYQGRADDLTQIAKVGITAVECTPNSLSISIQLAVLLLSNCTHVTHPC